jgi:hypothetical protein
MTEKEDRETALQTICKMKELIASYDMFYYQFLKTEQYKQVTDLIDELQIIKEQFENEESVTDNFILITAFKNKLHKIEEELFSSLEKEN